MKFNMSKPLAIALTLGTIFLSTEAVLGQETARGEDPEARSLEENVEDFLKEIMFATCGTA